MIQSINCWQEGTVFVSDVPVSADYRPQWQPVFQSLYLIKVAVPVGTAICDNWSADKMKTDGPDLAAAFPESWVPPLDALLR